MNIEKICKLLNLSQSRSDDQALSAIRKANKILRSHNKVWENLLLEKPEIKEENTNFSVHKDWWNSLTEIQKTRIFSTLLDINDPRYFYMLNRINNYWYLTGFLTDKQIRAIHIYAKKMGVI